MILQNRNHPSIILWGVHINESVDDDAFYNRTNKIAHQLDPSRATSGVRYHRRAAGNAGALRFSFTSPLRGTANKPDPPVWLVCCSTEWAWRKSAPQHNLKAVSFFI